ARKDTKMAPRPSCKEQTDDYPRLDCFSQADLIRQHAAASGQRVQGESRRLHLMRIEVDAGLAKRRGQPMRSTRIGQGQLFGKHALVEPRQAPQAEGAAGEHWR